MRMSRTCFGIGAAVALCGCGSGSSSSVGTTSTPPAPQMVTVIVGGDGNSFAPATVDIHAGDTVHWVWQSGPHTVTSGANGVADGTFCSLPAGEAASAARCASTEYATSAPATYDYTFPTAGSFPYFCTVHGTMMSGLVNVAVGGGSGGGGGGGGGGSSGGGGGY